MERLVVVAPILADIAAEPDGTGSRITIRRIDGWGRWRLNEERVTALLAACAGRS
jgi:hypothetical protein